MQMSKTTGLLILCVWLLPVASMKLLPFGWPLYPVEIVLLAALPFLSSRERGKFFLQSSFARSVSVCAGLFLLGNCLSYYTHPNGWTGLGQIKSFFFFPLLFWVMALEELESVQKTERVLWHMRAMMAVSGAAALLWGVWHGLTYDHRLSAWFDSPNLLAIFLLPGAVLWLAQVATAKRFIWTEVLAWIAITGALFLTRSYGAIGAFLLAGGFFLWRERTFSISRVPWRVMGLVLALFIIFLSFETGTEKWSALAEGNIRSSFESRIMIWRSAVKMVAENVWTGIGPGRFQTVYLEYQSFYPPYLEWAVPHPHNLFLAFWLASGVLGAGAFLWLVSLLFVFFRTSPSCKEKSLSLAILLSFFVVGLVDVPYFRSEFSYLFWFTLAWITALAARDQAART